MADYDVDLFVIGAGSGGVRAARLASSTYGARVAIAEEDRFGGTCVVRGCVPKKLLVYAAEYGHAFDHARGYGWEAGEPTFDWSRLITNKDAEIDRLTAIYRRNLENAGVEIHRERAVVVGPHRVKLGRSGREISAKTVLIATGGTPWRPLDLPGQELGITSNEAFHLPRLPRHVIVAGGGYIACEFAGIFAGLGVETCLLYRGDTVLRGFDMDVRTAVHAELKRKGIRVITQAIFERIEERPGEARHLRATLSNGAVIDADCIMFAIGRTPNTAGLGLETAGVQLDDKGAVIVDPTSRTNVDHIYAIGDVTDRVALTPVAIREAIAFAKTAFGGTPTAYDHTNIPTAVFTQPPVGVVGLTEADARRAFGEVDIYKTNFRPMKHMLTGDEERVLMKLVVRRSDQVVVGVHMVGIDAPEIIQMAGIAVKAGLTKSAWDDTCAVHPTVAEEFVTLKEPWRAPELA